jgi:membrane protein implicated in regulation of membrane protease activity
MTELSIFAPLDGVSPWLWLTLALVLGAVELAATSFFLIWVALAAAGVALALALAPGLSGTGQMSLFAALSVGFTFAGRSWLRARRGQGGERPVLNRRAAALIGRRAKIVRPFDSGLGGVEVDGALWRARLAPEGAAPVSAAPALAEGETVRIHGVDGAVLLVSP